MNISSVTEPRLCRKTGVTREFEDQLPFRGYDGARQTDYYPCQTCQYWFHRKLDTCS